MENHQGRRVEHKQTPSASQNRKRRKRRNPTDMYEYPWILGMCIF